MPNADYLKTTSFLTGAQVDQKIDESMLEVTDTNGVIISSDESAGSSLVYTFSSATYTATVASGGGYTSTAI